MTGNTVKITPTDSAGNPIGEGRTYPFIVGLIVGFTPDLRDWRKAASRRRVREQRIECQLRIRDRRAKRRAR